MTSSTPFSESWHEYVAPHNQVVGKISFMAGQLIDLKRMAEKDVSRLEYLEVELDAYRKFIMDYLNIHGLEDKMSERANDLLHHELCRKNKIHDGL